MKTTRRQFLKISGLTTTGLFSGLPAFSQFFESIPAEEQTFIPTIGILPRPDSILDRGVHLRWQLPPSKGIPILTNIYRRKSVGENYTITRNPADSGELNLPKRYQELTFGGYSPGMITLADNPNEKAYQVKINPMEKLRISFSENVEFVKLQLGRIDGVTIQVFFPDGSFSHELEATSNNLENRSVEIRTNNGRPFKHIEIPLNFSHLYSIEFSGNEYLCSSEGWDLIGKINNREDVFGKRLISRISDTTQNFYIKNKSDFNRYRETARQYEGLLASFLELKRETFRPNPLFQSLQSTPFDQLQIQPKDDNADAVNAWNLLVFGSIDPNIARMLGLYYVDTKITGPGSVFDYKVEAFYKNAFFKNSICGVAVNVGEQYAEIPKIGTPLTLTQTDETHWEFDKEYVPTHLGKVRLSWGIQNQNPNNQSWKRFNQPVVHGLTIDGTSSKLISPRQENSNYIFVDHRATFSKNPKKYELIGVDIFGQQSSPISSSLRMIDKDLPASPHKLNFINSGDDINLNFDYGGFQYLADPEIHKFNVYQKLDSIYKQNLKVSYTSCIVQNRTEDGLPYIEITLSQPVQTTYKWSFVHFIEDFEGKKLPASKRKKFQITNQTSTSVRFKIQNDLAFQPESKGTVLLESDPKDKANGWENLNMSQEFKSPIETRLRDYIRLSEIQSRNQAHGFAVNITGVKPREYSETPDLFNPESNEGEADLYTEITIDRTLNESNIFSGGTIIINSNSYQITFQNAGIGNSSSEGLKATLIVPGHPEISRGAALLFPPGPDADNEYIENHLYLFGLENRPNIGSNHTGEFLMRGTRRSVVTEEDEFGREIRKEISEQIHIIATLVSDVSLVNGQLQVLVKITQQFNQLHLTTTDKISNKVLYFKPYRINITDIINTVPLLPNDPYKSMYFSASATDKANREGPLSVIAQFLKTRSKFDKPPTPPRPFPCGNQEATEGFLKLPNSEGNSYFEICWNGVSEYRYEVGRTLDKTLIACHRDLWLRGLFYSNDSSPITGQLTEIVNTSTVTGLVSAKISITQQQFNPKGFIGGRLFQSSESRNDTRTNESVENQRKYFEIISIKLENPNSFDITLRPMEKGTQPLLGSCSLQILPNYSGILEDDNLLRQLADIGPTRENPKIPDSLGAFSLVTEQPLRNSSRFLDEVPGLGNSRFFYKVRAVDGSENRSLWSGASVPVWQVDVSVPEKIDNLEIHKIGNSIYLSWKNVNDKNISHYKVYKKTESDYDLLNQVYLKPNNSQKKINYLPIRIRKSQIDLSFNQELIQSISNDNRDGIIGVFQIDHETDTQGSVNYIVNNVTTFNGAIITNINPLLENDTQVVLTILKNKVFSIAFNRLRSKKLIVKSQKIILDYPYEINEVIGIYKFDEFDHDKIPIANQDATNYFINSNSFDSVKNEISNITNIVENTEVIVIVRGDHKSTLFTNNENPILFIDNTIQLTQGQLDSSSKIIGIFKNSDYDRNKLFEEQVCYNYVIREITRIENNLLKGLLSPKTIYETFTIKQSVDNEDIIFLYNKTKFEYEVQLEPGQNFDLEYTVRPVKAVNNISTHPIYIEANK